MSRFRGIFEISAKEWRNELGWTAGDVPDVLVVEGSWWREQRTRWRLSHLSKVQELKFPDIFVGERQGRRVAFCCAYGAARTAEVVHLFALMGTKLVVQIGTCGGLQPHLRPGDVILPENAIAQDGVAQLYGATDRSEPARNWNLEAERLLRERGRITHMGTHLTWPTLFAQSGEMCARWHQLGYLSVDMETATTFAVARKYGAYAVSMLVVWDQLTAGRSFLDPLSAEELRALDDSNAAVYEVALDLSGQLIASA